MNRVLLLIMFFLFLAMTACSSSKQADIVLKGGKVVTVDSDFSLQQAIALSGNRIVYVGTNRGVDRFVGENTQVIDCSNLLILPGLIDSHAHLHSLGESLSNLNISDSTSYSQIIDTVRKALPAYGKGEWIIGGRWDQTSWEDSAFPDHEALSRITPDNPVYLRRIDGNAAFANGRALEIADINRNSKDPFGGVIQRRPDGEPTGVLVNRAMNLVLEHIPANTKDQTKDKFLKAVDHCLTFGLTGIHEAGVGPTEIQLYKDLIDQERLPLRIYAMLGEQEQPPLQGDLVAYFRKHRLDNYGDHFLSVRSIKLFFDGALGSRGAAFFDPYSDDPGNIGLLRVTPEYITRVSIAALENRMGVNTHCIGTRGNQLCLDAYEEALVKYPGRDHRFRIEHAQIIREEDIARFYRLGVIPAMQPTHCTSDMGFVEERVGSERAAGAYAWRAFLEAGCFIPCGSDFPVESANPMLGIYAAVTRQDIHGRPENGWFPGQRMSVREAIMGFTIWSAKAAFQEEVLGSLEVGKLADITVLDRDIFEIDAGEIPGTRAVMTIVAGKIRFSRLQSRQR